MTKLAPLEIQVQLTIASQVDWGSVKQRALLKERMRGWEPNSQLHNCEPNTLTTKPLALKKRVEKIRVEMMKNSKHKSNTGRKVHG